MRLKTMILSMKVLLLGAAVTTAAATATAQGTTRTTGTERTVHAGDYVTTITVDGTPTTITDDVKSVTAAPGAKVKVTAAPPQQGKRARLVITKAASSSSGQGGSGNGGSSGEGGQTQNIPVEGIKILGPTMVTVFYVGTSYQFKARVSPSDASTQGVTWSVTDDLLTEYTSNTSCDLADISESGELYCKKPGAIVVFAKAKDGSGIYGTTYILVKEPDPQPQTGENGGGQGTGEVTPGTTHDLKIIVPNNVTEIKVGDYITLSATDNGLPAFVNWSFSDRSMISAYATIDANGKLTGTHPGNVTVTATLEDITVVTASITITIYAR